MREDRELSREEIDAFGAELYALRERTLAGLAAARSRGRKGGRPASLSPSQRKAALSMMKGNDMTIAEISEHFGVSRSTLYNLVAESRAVQT